MNDTQPESETKPHHHGDLKNALVEATIQILRDQGIKGLSLRKAAALAGVSHAAPAHHFGNVEGLLAAVAARGYEKFATALRRDMAEAAPDPHSQVKGIARGYMAFADQSPDLLELMFRVAYKPKEDFGVFQASSESYGLLKQVAAPFACDAQDARRVEGQIWSMVHGYALLRLSGRLGCDPDDPSGDVETMLSMFDNLPLARPQRASRHQDN